MEQTTEDTRLSKLRDYLFGIINTLTTNRNYQINANMLSNDIDDYSLDKMPDQTKIESYITGTKRYREVYSFKSRKVYSQDILTNLETMGFFEQFEDAIDNNSEEGILPSIEGIEELNRLTPFTFSVNDDGKSAIFDIQIEIIYEK